MRLATSIKLPLVAIAVIVSQGAIVNLSFGAATVGKQLIIVAPERFLRALENYAQQ